MVPECYYLYLFRNYVPHAPGSPRTRQWQLGRETDWFSAELYPFLISSEFTAKYRLIIF